jgi:hypothetical protein
VAMISSISVKPDDLSLLEIHTETTPKVNS